MSEQQAQENKYFTHKDIYDAISRNGREIDITKEYDPEVFWNSLGGDWFKTFKKKEQFSVNAPWLIDKFKVLKPKTVLEVGCGFGRLHPLLLDAKVCEETHGVDIAENILKSSEEYLAPVEVKEGQEAPPDFRSKIHLRKGDARKLSEELSDRYDVVFTSETLMHISPEDLHSAILECVRVSKKYVVFIERWGFPSEHSEPHLWSHNLVQELKALGLNILQATTINQGMIGIVACKK